MRIEPNADRAAWPTLHATCDEGLEAALSAELSAMGAAGVLPGRRGVAFRGDRNLLWRANLQSRIATRILFPIAEFSARDRESLWRESQHIDWGEYLTSRQSVTVEARTLRSRLDQTGMIAGVVQDAIVERLRRGTGRRPTLDRRAADVPVHVRIADDHCTVSLDSSGARLERRGYRVEGGPSPLGETLVAGVLALAGFEGQSPLVDPLCGAGTVVVEAALVARRFAPGLFRIAPGGEGFAFQRWRGHDREAFRRLAHIVRAAARPAPLVAIAGFDADDEAIAAARRNAARAGMKTDVRLERRALADAVPVGDGGVVVTQVAPADDDAMADTARALSAVLRRRFAGHRAWVVCDPVLTPAFELPIAQAVPVFDGTLERRLLRFDLV